MIQMFRTLVVVLVCIVVLYALMYFILNAFNVWKLSGGSMSDNDCIAIVRRIIAEVLMNTETKLQEDITNHKWQYGWELESVYHPSLFIYRKLEESLRNTKYYDIMKKAEKAINSLLDSIYSIRNQHISPHSKYELTVLNDYTEGLIHFLIYEYTYCNTKDARLNEFNEASYWSDINAVLVHEKYAKGVRNKYAMIFHPNSIYKVLHEVYEHLPIVRCCPERNYQVCYNFNYGDQCKIEQLTRDDMVDMIRTVQWLLERKLATAGWLSTHANFRYEGRAIFNLTRFVSSDAYEKYEFHELSDMIDKIYYMIRHIPITYGDAMVLEVSFLVATNWYGSPRMFNDRTETIIAFKKIIESINGINTELLNVLDLNEYGDLEGYLKMLESNRASPNIIEIMKNNAPEDMKDLVSKIMLYEEVIKEVIEGLNISVIILIISALYVLKRFNGMNDIKINDIKYRGDIEIVLVILTWNERRYVLRIYEKRFEENAYSNCMELDKHDFRHNQVKVVVKYNSINYHRLVWDLVEIPMCADAMEDDMLK